MSRIKPHIGTDEIKIFTGIKRAGKTSIMRAIRESLLNDGISEGSILFYELEAAACADITSAPALFRELVANINPHEKTYIFLDEIGRVSDWEKVVLSLSNDYLTDIYISSSDKSIITKDIPDMPDEKRCIIEILPLCFDEYLQLRSNRSLPLAESFSDYLKSGGFPVIASGNFGRDEARMLSSDLCASVIYSELILPGKIRKAELLSLIYDYILEKPGEAFSALTMAKLFKEKGIKIDNATAYSYMEKLENAGLVHRCPRFDIRKGEVLKTRECFYPVELSAISEKASADGQTPEILRSVLYNELRSRGYEVYSGILGKKHIDFVGINETGRIYIALGIPLAKNGDETSEKIVGYEDLLSIPDNHPKFIIRTDEHAGGNIDGINIVKLTDFLLAK